MDTADTPLMPVRRLHNFVYCPRLFYLQWVEDLFVEDAQTAEGSFLHRNADKPSHWKDDLDLAERASLRSVALESTRLGLTGVVDLIEDMGQGRELIDYKRGSARVLDDGQRVPKENDALQIAAYALLLEERGLGVKRASIYYASDRRRVAVELTPALLDSVGTTLKAAQATAASGVCPPPLRDDPRCLHCSAYSICLPNESSYWAGEAAGSSTERVAPRPPRDDGEIVILQNPRARAGCRAGMLTISLEKETVSKHPLEQLQAVYIYGGCQISTQAVHSLLERGIPISYFSPAGRFLGMTAGLPTSGIDSRLGQARVFSNPAIRLVLARECVRAKIHNQRVLLMRNGDVPASVISQMADLRDACAATETLESLRGVEGRAAALYFGHFGSMLKGADVADFDFNGRNRRPPMDPVNALLSMGYSILAKELTGTCHTVGLDPFIGFFHQPRFGRPALALDLMEEFRPLIADSVAISLLNRKEIDASDFVRTTKGVFLNENGRRQFWQAWFRRLDSEVRHPQFGYRMAYRRMLDVQARQIWRFFRGEAPGYHGFTVR